jgi:hypothetical protein
MARRRVGVCLRRGEKYEGVQLAACPMFRNLDLLRTSELCFVILKLKGGNIINFRMLLCQASGTK